MQLGIKITLSFRFYRRPIELKRVRVNFSIAFHLIPESLSAVAKIISVLLLDWLSFDFLILI